MLWTGETPIQGAAELVAAAQRTGKKVLFVTNNSTKTIDKLMAKFDRLGIKGVQRDQVMSAAVSAAVYLKEHVPSGRKVYVIGEPGLRQTIRSHGLAVCGEEDEGKSVRDMQGFDVKDLDPEVGAVAVGWDGSFCYAKLLKASMYIRYQKVMFVSTNRDAASPMLDSGGMVPGGGSMVAAVECAGSCTPTNTGKPSQALARTLLNRHGLSDRPETVCMVGDRIDTDILFGNNAGMQTCLVLSGATSPEQAASAQGPSRPTFIAKSVAGLLKGTP